MKLSEISVRLTQEGEEKEGGEGKRGERKEGKMSES